MPKVPGAKKTDPASKKVAKTISNNAPTQSSVKAAKVAGAVKMAPLAFNKKVHEVEVLEPEILDHEPDFEKSIRNEIPQDSTVAIDVSAEKISTFNPETEIDLKLNDVKKSKARQALPAIARMSNLPATQDPLSQYLSEIRHYPLLTADQERELAIQFHDHQDREAAEKLVTSNLRFVVKIAAEYSKFGARIIDLVQEGNVGLMQAVKEFNPYRNVRLITYAVWWIRGYIREYLMRQYSMVRVGTTHNQKKLFYNLQQEEQRLESLGENFDTHAISESLGVPEHDVETMKMRMRGRDVSLDQPLDDESKSSLMDLQTSGTEDSPEAQLAHGQELRALRSQIEKIRPQLNSKELFILENRLLSDEPMTLQEIGDKVGVTRERSRQIEARVLDKIRKLLEEAIGIKQPEEKREV